MLLRPFLVLLLLDLASPDVFMGNDEAHQVLTRHRRANSFLEEMKQGDMERECNEERCSYEEAREIFEDKEKTEEFWSTYLDGDACESHPCANGGVCKDGIGSYSCYCQTGYQGYNCEIVIPELCENNGECQHFCRVVDENVQCSCASGYFLSSDDKTCESNEPFKCGVPISDQTRTIFMYERSNETSEIQIQLNQTDLDSQVDRHIMETLGLFNNTNTTREYYSIEDVIKSMEEGKHQRIVDGEDCPPGECPWQALIVDENHKGFCGGTILTEYIILTAAHCMARAKYIYVKLGEFDLMVHHGNEATHLVERITRHNGYTSNTYQNDIALIKLTKPIKFSRFILPACLPEKNFAEKVLMRQPQGMVSGFGKTGERSLPSSILKRLMVPYVDRQICLESSKMRIFPRMFCAGYDQIAKDACQGDSGGPHVTPYQGTYFVTGIVSWGEGCAREGKYGVYTQISKYLDWIHSGIERLMASDSKSNSRNKRQHKTIKKTVL